MDGVSRGLGVELAESVFSSDGTGTFTPCKHRFVMHGGVTKRPASHVWMPGAETLVDIKGLGIGKSLDYASIRAEQGLLKPIDRRGVKVQGNAARSPRTSTASTTTLQTMRIALSNPLFRRSGLWRTSPVRGHSSRARNQLLRRAICWS